MTGKILQLVNSALFGTRQWTSNPKMAVTLLRVKTVLAVVLSVHVFSQLKGAAAGVDLDSLWAHSALVGNFDPVDVDARLRAGRELCVNQFEAAVAPC